MIFIKKPDARKASPLRYLVFIFNLFRLPARSDILHFCDVTALPLEFQPLLIRAGAPFCVA